MQTNDPKPWKVPSLGNRRVSDDDVTWKKGPQYDGHAVVFAPRPDEEFAPAPKPAPTEED